MEILEIVKESLMYPLKDYKNWLTIGVVYLIIAIMTVLVLPHGGAAAIIGALLVIVLSFLICGFDISVRRSTLNNENAIPMIAAKKNIIDGIKYAAIGLIYLLVPLIIIAIIAYPIGFYYNLNRLLPTFTAIITGVDSNIIASQLPQHVLVNFLNNIMVLITIFPVLLLIVSFFMQLSLVILADSDSLKESLNISQVINKMKHIGVLKYTIVVIAINIIQTVLILFSYLLLLIPYMGLMIYYFIIGSYSMLIISRGVTMAYMDNKKEDKTIAEMNNPTQPPETTNDG